jgi:organic anion transporter 5A
MLIRRSCSGSNLADRQLISLQLISHDMTVHVSGLSRTFPAPFPRLSGWSPASWLAGWMAGWLDGWMVGWLDGWLDGWMAGWLAG